MVVDYGMSDAVGYVSFNMQAREGEPLLEKPFSEATSELIDREVKRIIDEVRAETRRLLEEKRDLLEALAQALLTKEVLNENDIVEVLGPRPFKRAVHEGTPVNAEGEPVNDPRTHNPPRNGAPPALSGDGAPAAPDPLTAGDEGAV
jgi:cell division protease FtsH